MTQVPISSQFWKGLVTVSAIGAGVLYIENSIKTTIKESLVNVEYRINALEVTDEKNAKSISDLAMSNNTMNMVIKEHEEKMKEGIEYLKRREFVKPDEPTLSDK